MKKVLAIDMGATSIRGIIGYLDNGKITLEEVDRFSHDIVNVDGRMRWQWNKIIGNINACIAKHKDEICSVGIDTWGVDFGLLDHNGNLLADPISYRDEYNSEGLEIAKRSVGEKELFCDTGTQIMSINTLFQLLVLRERDIETFKQVSKILMMPDLIQYFLTGNMQGEETIWSTSQILNLDNKRFSSVAQNLLGFHDKIYPSISKAGTITGKIKDSDISVVNVCGHDTASAVLLTRAMYDSNTMFLSCGTWSLFGVRAPKALLTEEVYEADLTNELGYDSANLLFKNITGLYLLEKFKAQLENIRGSKISFDEITDHTQKLFDANPELDTIIDITDPRFASPNVDAINEIRHYIEENGGTAPQDPMDYFRIIYDSLISEYIKTRELIEHITGKHYTKLHMIGGGAKSSLLCRRIVSRMNVELTAGPYEASALGNILIQLVAMGEFSDMASAIECALNSVKTDNYKK